MGNVGNSGTTMHGGYRKIERRKDKTKKEKTKTKKDKPQDKNTDQCSFFTHAGAIPPH